METEILNGVVYAPKAGVGKISAVIKELVKKHNYKYYDFRWEHILSLPRKKKKLMKKLAMKLFKKI